MAKKAKDRLAERIEAVRVHANEQVEKDEWVPTGGEIEWVKIGPRHDADEQHLKDMIFCEIVNAVIIRSGPPSINEDQAYDKFWGWAQKALEARRRATDGK